MLGAALTLCALIAFATELDIDQDVQGAAIDSEQKQHLQQAVGLGEEALAEWGSAEKASQGKEKAGTEKASPEKASPEKASPGIDKASPEKKAELGEEEKAMSFGRKTRSTSSRHKAKFKGRKVEQLGEKMGLWRRRRRGSGFFQGLVNLVTPPRRRRTKSNWYPNRPSNPAVRLCPFDLCPAMEHGANKVCVGTDLNHAVLGFAVC